MKIFVFGNINSGKSFLVNRLSKYLENYNIIQIDQFRKTYSDRFVEGEDTAQQKFIQDIQKNKNAIIEFSGGGQIASDLYNIVDDNSIFILNVKSDINTCIDRIKQKDFSKIPYPDYGEEIETTIKNIAKKYDEENFIHNFWQEKSIKIINVESDVSIDSLFLGHYDLLDKIVNTLRNRNVSLFSFGSLARDNIEITSDLDLFCLSNYSFDDIYKLLKESFFNNLDYTFSEYSNKIIIKTIDNILVEIIVINNIQECFKFYYFSEIINIKKTILIDNFDGSLYEKLKGINKNYEYNFYSNIKEIIQRISYFTDSLPSLIKKDDDYKYYFHSNIISHEYIKLKYILCGKKEFLYLPKNAKNYLSDYEYENIFYKIYSNKDEHYKIIKKHVNNILFEIQKEFDI